MAIEDDSDTNLTQDQKKDSVNEKNNSFKISG